ncbi:MAG: hypothetical protein AABY22_21480, partial [Nanoarchaeota archaeon]
PRLNVTTNHYMITGTSFFFMYGPRDKVKGITKSITAINQTNQSGYIDLSWQSELGIGSSSNEYQIIRSGYLGPYGRLRCLEDILILKNTTVIPFGGDIILGRTETSTSGIFNLMITSIEEPLVLED